MAREEPTVLSRHWIDIPKYLSHFKISKMKFNLLNLSKLLFKFFTLQFNLTLVIIFYWFVFIALHNVKEIVRVRSETNSPDLPGI